MTKPAPVLLGGPYEAPALRRGDRATCRYRRQPCPGERGGGTGLLVTEELVRAITSASGLFG
jgi:hypothetical protein